MIDPHDPTLEERLRRRNLNGHFEISEIELVLGIRDLRAKGDNESVPEDQYKQLHAIEESLRILTFLSDPLDRKIMVLRAIQHMKWDDIALICKRTERAIRLRYERARSYLRECILSEKTMHLQVS